MNEQNIRHLMIGFIVVGIALILTGVYFIVFTDMVTAKGTSGIFTIAGFIAGGLFLSVPAKIYLTLQLMKYNDEKLRMANVKNNEN